MLNDKQSSLKSWQAILQENQEYLKLINQRESFKVAISYAREVSGEGSSNLIVVNNKLQQETNRKRVLGCKILVQAIWVLLHSYILFYVATFKAGHCYASLLGNMVPMFDDPPVIQVHDIEINFGKSQNYSALSEAEQNLHTPVSLRLIVLLIIEIAIDGVLIVSDII